MSLTFSDFCSGCGGTRLAFDAAGFKCVFSSEIDKFAAKSYEANFGDNPLSDLKTLALDKIPNFDVLVAGFSCQPFSQAGMIARKYSGIPTGFDDKIIGDLFFYIAAIIGAKQPQVFMLENVKGLVSHNNGRTLQQIEKILGRIGYFTKYAILDAKAYVPQHRERLFIVGFKDINAYEKFNFPALKKVVHKLQDFLLTNQDEFTLSNDLWSWLQSAAEKHGKLKHGFSYSIANLESYARTLTSRYYKDGKEILIPQEGKNPRKLSPRECARLMGFPDSYKIVVSNTQAYKQFGNSVVVPLVTEIAQNMKLVLE